VCREALASDAMLFTRASCQAAFDASNTTALASDAMLFTRASCQAAFDASQKLR
jgi:hypothetical protein